MVLAFHPNLLRFVHELHRCDRAVGIEELLRGRSDLPNVRSVYRWHEELGDDLTYFPAVTYEALGLRQLHLVIDDPRADWERLPYAVRASWLTRFPGMRVLYLHCLVPASHLASFMELLDECTRHHDGDRVTSITTGDGWQVLHGDTAAPVVIGASAVAAWEVVERYPLLIPVICEGIEVRRSLPELWSMIAARLGARVWDFLPRGTRRMPHNGKAYVRDALRLLNDAFLFRQHVVRYAAYDAITMEVVLRVRAGPEEMVRLASSDAPILEVFPSEEECLVRLHGTLACLTHLFTSFATLNVTEWWFVDRIATTRAPVRVRFAYELLFDPATATWLFPRDEIIRRLSR